jgi:hypothetical protein
MLLPPLQFAKRTSAAVMFSERLRVRAELLELIIGTRQTMAQSWALLAEADAILAREKLPLVAPMVLAGQGTIS